MGLENLKSIFTEGMKKMNNSDLSSVSSNTKPFSPPSISDKIGKTATYKKIQKQMRVVNYHK